MQYSIFTVAAGVCLTTWTLHSFDSHNIAWLVACPCYEDRDSGVSPEGMVSRVSVW